jgi:hypothetical protein
LRSDERCGIKSINISNSSFNEKYLKISRRISGQKSKNDDEDMSR